MIEKIEEKEEFNGIDDIKKSLSDLIKKVNEIVELLNNTLEVEE